MNRTTVKRGIGAVILALIAAALLAFLLKDKAAQRQEVVEISLPGTEGTVDTASQTDRLPTLTTDNSGNDGSVIANAGSGSGTGNDSTTGNTVSVASGTGSGAADTGSNASGTNSDGTIIASAAAVGAAGAAAVAGAAGTTTKTMDFSVKPRTPKASGEFLDLDLVNNSESKPTETTAKVATAASTGAAATAAQQTGGSSATNTDQGIVIASTAPKSGGASASNNAPQPRLIGEKNSAPVKSSNTARVISSKKAPAKSAKKDTSTTKSSSTKKASESKNGYAIQLLATSSKTRANNLKNVMAGEGYPTYVTTTKQNGKTLYRVRIGQYARKSQAVKAQSAMKRRYKKNTNVNRSAVVAR